MCWPLHWVKAANTLELLESLDANLKAMEVKGRAWFKPHDNESVMSNFISG